MTVKKMQKENVLGAVETDEYATAKDYRSLYKAHEKIYPKRVHGKFRSLKSAVLAITLGAFFALPWLRWDRGAGVPDQAFLLDFAHQRMYLFGIELWAQELYYVTGILIISGLGLFFVSAVAGRLWCGYACPQTVWTDLMIAVEEFWQGDRSARIRLAKSPWTFDKIWKYAATHTTWLLISLLTGITAVIYFRDAPTLGYEFLTNSAPSVAYVFVGIFAAFTYLLGALGREQMCIYMCPWPRIQAAMFDSDSMLISYRAFRGEPRGPHKKGASWEGRGDCIDCKQCIAACPTGIDIRQGPQLECIQCSLCIDACDAIMDQIARPRGLIAYDSFRNLDAESHGDRAPMRFIRPRTLLYGGVFAVVVTVMALALTYKSVLDVNVVPERNPLYFRLADGSIRNTYTVRVLNKTYETRTYTIGVEGIQGAHFWVAGQEGLGEPKITVKPDDLIPVTAFVSLPQAVAQQLSEGRGQLTFIVRDVNDGTQTSRVTNFNGPDR